VVEAGGEPSEHAAGLEVRACISKSVEEVTGKLPYGYV
jgi:hypothetical protein